MALVADAVPAVDSQEEDMVVDATAGCAPGKEHSHITHEMLQPHGRDQCG